MTIYPLETSGSLAPHHFLNSALPLGNGVRLQYHSTVATSGTSMNNQNFPGAHYRTVSGTATHCATNHGLSHVAEAKEASIIASSVEP